MPTTYPSREDHEDLGDGVSFTWLRGPADDKLIGLAEYHQSLVPHDTRICWALAVWVAGSGWQVSHELVAGGLDDQAALTVSPSLTCPQCGHSGSIVDGKWVTG